MLHVVNRHIFSINLNKTNEGAIWRHGCRNRRRRLFRHHDGRGVLEMPCSPNGISITLRRGQCGHHKNSSKLHNRYQGLCYSLLSFCERITNCGVGTRKNMQCSIHLFIFGAKCELGSFSFSPKSELNHATIFVLFCRYKDMSLLFVTNSPSLMAKR